MHDQLRIRQAVDFLEQNLDQPISLDTLAEVGCYSKYHFHRLFQAYTGETLLKFHRRLRLERAAGKLLIANDPITEVAMAAGFDSPSAFNKAFKAQFGCTPSHFKETGPLGLERPTPLPEISPIRPEGFDPQVVERPEQQWLSCRGTGAYQTAAQEAFGKLMAICGQLGWLQQPPETLNFYGIPRDNPSITESDLIRYDACIEVLEPNKSLSQLATLRTRPKGRYLRFEHHGGVSSISKSYGYFYRYWLPDSGLQPGVEPGFEHYIDWQDPEHSPVAIYIPL